MYAVGDTSQRFTIQSACKPVLYGIAMRERGESAVHAKEGRCSLPVYKTSVESAYNVSALESMIC
jgi:glutaminase